MNARDYYLSLLSAIHRSPFVLRSDIIYDEIDLNECYVHGTAGLLNGHELHIAEYVITEPAPVRSKYRYHLQDADGQLISRWDNAPHHRELASFPDHRHGSDGRVQPSYQIVMPEILDAVLRLIS